MGLVARLSFAILLAAAAAGCTSVYTAKPVGKTPVALYPKEWEGLWIGELDRDFEDLDEPVSVPVIIKVRDRDRGILEVWAMTNSDNGYSAGVQSVHIRRFGDTLFASWSNPALGSGRFLWGVVRKSAGQILLYVPDGDRFRALVEGGTVPGVVTPAGDVSLADLGDDHLARFARSGDLYSRFPIVLSRWETRSRPAAFPRVPEPYSVREKEAPSPGAAAEVGRRSAGAGEAPAPPAPPITIADLRTGYSDSPTPEELPGLSGDMTSPGTAAGEKSVIGDSGVQKILRSLYRPVTVGRNLMTFTPAEIYRPGVGFAWNAGPISGFHPGHVEFRGHLAEGSGSGPYLILKESGTRIVDFVLAGAPGNLLACDVNANDNQIRIRFRLHGTGDNVASYHVVVVADYRAPDSWAPDKGWGSIRGIDGIGLQCQVLEGDPSWYFLRAEVYHDR